MEKQDQEFNIYAGNYREIHTQNVQAVSGQDSNFFTEYKIKEIASRNILAEDASWLDLGCGDGNSFRFIKKYFPGSSYQGIDVSEESVKIARSNNDNADVFMAYDGKTIPFPDGTFDVVFIACVMHHILPENRANIISECRRVLKKGGKLIIFEHNPNNPVTMKLVNTCPFDDNAILLKCPECKSVVKAGGFENVKSRFTIFLPRKGIFNKLLGIEKALTWLPLGGQYYVVAD